MNNDDIAIIIDNHRKTTIKEVPLPPIWDLGGKSDAKTSVFR